MEFKDGSRPRSVLQAQSEGYQQTLCRNGCVLPIRVTNATKVWQRAVGLLLERDLPENQGLWIKPCRAIHTVGMAYSIDAVFLDEDGRVCGISHQLRPNRVAANKNAASVLELRGGVAEGLGIAPGDYLSGLSGCGDDAPTEA